MANSGWLEVSQAGFSESKERAGDSPRTPVYRDKWEALGIPRPHPGSWPGSFCCVQSFPTPRCLTGSFSQAPSPTPLLLSDKEMNGAACPHTGVFSLSVFLGHLSFGCDEGLSHCHRPFPAVRAQALPSPTDLPLKLGRGGADPMQRNHFL